MSFTLRVVFLQSPAVEPAVCGVGEPYCEHEDDGMVPTEGKLKSAGKGKLPNECNGRCIQREDGEPAKELQQWIHFKASLILRVAYAVWI